MKKKVAIVTLAVALENEKGYSRFRTLSKILSDDYEVDLITSTFQHWEKRQRDEKNVRSQNSSYNIYLAYEPGYKKNVDLKRIKSHKIAVKNILNILARSKYDLIYCIIPDNRMAAEVGLYAKKNGIKYIVDIEDLWPEAMEMVSPFPAFLDRFLFSGYRRCAKTAYRCADAFVGTSDEYRDVPEKRYGIKEKTAITVYVGCDLKDFDAGVDEYSCGIKKNKEEFWVTYAGNLGSSYDIGTMIRSAQLLYKYGISDIKFKILGGGPLEEDFKSIAEESDCFVEFVGYVPYKKMAAYLSKSDILVNSFVKKAPQSIVTKIGDYLASGRPMINTCSSLEFMDKVNKDGFGVNIEAEDEHKLADLIKSLKDEPKKLTRMGRNARLIAEKEFDRDNSYLEIKRMIWNLIGK